MAESTKTEDTGYGVRFLLLQHLLTAASDLNPGSNERCGGAENAEQKPQEHLEGSGTRQGKARWP